MSCEPATRPPNASVVVNFTKGKAITKKGRKPMFKSFAVTGFAVALGLAAWLLPMQGKRATAQSGPLHILVVEYDIVPAEIDNYLKAIKELAAAAVNEPGYRQLSIAVSQKDANHVLLFESWDNKAALDAFLASDRLARASLQRLKEVQPNLSIEWIEKYVPYTSRTMGKFVEGMRKAGLQLA
jgi:autoinducer 2-degrading protein